MIFDQQVCTPLVMIWQQSRDPQILDRIMVGVKGLVEAIVTGYDPLYRDDLIQESYAKILYAIEYYDPKRANLHTFLTTVIKNICYSYINKEYKLARQEVTVELDFQLPYEDKYSDDDVLTSMMIRNRKRFPSIDVDTIDELTQFAYFSLEEGMKHRSIIIFMHKISTLPMEIVTIIFRSSVLYLRSRNMLAADMSTNGVNEFSILADIKEIIGNDAFSKLSTLCYGMNVKF